MNLGKKCLEIAHLVVWVGGKDEGVVGQAVGDGGGGGGWKRREEIFIL